MESDVIFFVAPTERNELKNLIGNTGDISMLPERLGCDVAWRAHGEWWGVQRKELKDLIQSIGDGRLAREIAQMKHLPLPMILIEGKIHFDAQDNLMWNSRGQTITREQWRKILLSIRDHGIHVDFTQNSLDTSQYVSMLAKWSTKGKHQSLIRRPGPVNYWGKTTNVDFAHHLLQGFDGIGLDRAKAIVDHFGGVPLEWTCTEKELVAVPGLGKITAKKLIEALERTPS